MISPELFSCTLLRSVWWRFPRFGRPLLVGPIPRRAVLLPAFGLAGVGVIAQAQTTNDTLAARLATITTDTGAFAPGFRDFSRFNTPGLCLAAARVTWAKFHVTLKAQSAADSTQMDTIGMGETAPIARACEAQVLRHGPPSSATIHDAYMLFDLALFEGNDTLARANLTKMVSDAPTPAKRDSVWVFGLRAYLWRGWPLAAQQLMAEVDAVGPAARDAQLQMHYLLQLHYAQQDADSIPLRREIDHVLQMTEMQPKHLDPNSYLFEELSFANLIILTANTRPDSVNAVATRMQRELSAYKTSPEVTKSRIWKDWPNFSVSAVINYYAPTWFTYRQRGGGVAAPRLQADYWFPPRGRASNDTVRPLPGKVNVICKLGPPEQGLERGTGYSARALVTDVQHWLAQYGADHLEVTLVRPAAGYATFGTDFQDVNEVRLFQTPAEEARLWDWYIHDYKQLPVTVAVQVQHYIWLPPPDGRRLAVSKVQFNDFWQHDPDAVETLKYYREHFQVDSVYGPRPGESGGACAITDRDGTLLYTSEGGGQETITLALKWLFEKQGAGRAVSYPLHHD